MKLYTEEQVKDMLELTNLNVQFHIDTMIPIELPSDEEIESKSSRVNPYMDDLEKVYNEAFLFCAKWMKGQILKQNK